MRPLFFYSSLKKTDEGHLKQMREGLRNIFFLLSLIYTVLKLLFWEFGHITAKNKF